MVKVLARIETIIKRIKRKNCPKNYMTKMIVEGDKVFESWIKKYFSAGMTRQTFILLKPFCLPIVTD